MKTSSSVRGRPRTFDRAEALDAAMRLFWERGYEATSIAELAAAMGVNPPSLYAAFGNKRQLFLEAVDRYQERNGGFIARALAEAPTAREAARRIFHAAAELYVRPDCPRGCMLAQSASVRGAGSEDIVADVAARRDGGRQAIRARLEAAVRAGDLPPATDTAGLAAFVMAVLHGMSAGARDGMDAAALRRIAEHAMAGWPPLGR
jgi:AcrR family transcriptional regulator